MRLPYNQHRSPSGDFAEDSFRSMRKIRESSATRAAPQSSRYVNLQKGTRGSGGKHLLLSPGGFVRAGR